MFFWSNNGRGDSIKVEDAKAILPKYNEPPCYIELITPKGKIQWEYSTVEARDKDMQELQKLRDDLRNR
jgi:hypothetical protein